MFIAVVSAEIIASYNNVYISLALRHLGYSILPLLRFYILLYLLSLERNKNDKYIII